MPPTPNQIQLAHDLYAAGLAPKGVMRQDYMDGPVYWRTTTQKWEPWRNIGDVWHLVLRCAIRIIPEGNLQGKHVISVVHDHEVVDDARDIPAAIARIALRLCAEEKSHA